MSIDMSNGTRLSIKTQFWTSFRTASPWIIPQNPIRMASIFCSLSLYFFLLHHQITFQAAFFSHIPMSNGVFALMPMANLPPWLSPQSANPRTARDRGSRFWITCFSCGTWPRRRRMEPKPLVSLMRTPRMKFLNDKSQT